MAVEYRVEFSSDKGSRIQWQLDILNNDFVGLATDLVCDGFSPIAIDWTREFDQYKPIQGSSAEIHLVLEDEGQYADFYDAPEYTYEIRLRWLNADGMYQDYWRGWINPVDGTEKVSTFPFSLSFSATDGLGLLKGKPVFRHPTTRDSLPFQDQQTPLIDYIQSILIETGLGLPLYVDSGLLTASGDPLLNNTVNEWNFYNEDQTERKDAYEVLEEILTPHNCKIVQADGRWYIYNASNHGGAGLLDTTTWKTYGYNAEPVPDRYEPGPDVTEDLTYLLTGTTGGGGGTAPRVITQEGIIATDTNTNEVTYTDGDTEIAFEMTNPSRFKVGDRLSFADTGFFYIPINWILGIGILTVKSIVGNTVTFDVNNSFLTFRAPTFIFVPGILWDIIGTLTYTVGGTDGTLGNGSLLPVNEDFQLSTRRPYASVQIDFDEFKVQNFVDNGIFNLNDSDILTGWEVGPNSLDQTIFTDENVFVDGGEGDESRRSIATNRNGNGVSSTGTDLWFRNTSNQFLPPNYPMKVEFDYQYRKNVQAGAADALLGRYIVYADWPIVSGVQTTFPFHNIRPQSFVGNGGLPFVPGLSNAAQGTRLVWNWEKDRWEGTTKTANLFQEEWMNKFETDTTGSWQSESKTLLTPASTYFGIAVGTPTGGELKIAFVYPSAKRGEGNASASTNTITTYVDNVSIKPQLSESEGSPVNERYQNFYSDTLNYEAALSSTTEDFVYNKIMGDNEYWRKGENGVDFVVGGSLEEVVTQQKLNDFRGGELGPFKYYEGTFVNNSPIPFSPIRKVRIDYVWTNENGQTREYVENSTLIQNGGDFEVKSNDYNIAMYVPNQATDFVTNIVTGLEVNFVEHNVDFVSAAPPDRDNLITYILGIRAIGTDENNVPIETPDASGVNPGDAGYVTTYGAMIPEEGFETNQINESFEVYEGRPGDTFSGNFLLKPGMGVDGAMYDISASNLSVETGTVSGLESLRFTDVGTNVQVSYKIILPADDDYTIMEIRGETDPFVGDNNRVDVTYLPLTGGTASTLAATTRTIINNPGSSTPIRAFVSPESGMAINATTVNLQSNAGVTVSVTSPITVPPIDPSTIIQSDGFVQLGNAIEWQGNVIIPENATSTVTVQFNIPQNAVSEVSTSDQRTATFTFVDNMANTSINRVTSPATFVLRGQVNTTFDFDVVSSAASGHTTTTDIVNVSETISGTSITLGPDRQEGPFNVVTTISGTFIDTNDSATFTFSGNAIEGGADNTDYNISFTNNIVDSSGTTSASLTDGSVALKGLAGSRFKYTNLITAVSGQNLSASNLSASGWKFRDVGPDQVEASRLVIFPTTGPTNETVILSATTTPEPFTLQVNLTNNVTNTMLSESFFAFGFDSDDVSILNPQTFTIQSNDSERTFMSTNEITTPASSTVSITYSGPDVDGVITGSIGGNYPTPNALGIAVADLDINPGNTTGAPSYTGAYGLIPSSTLVEYNSTDVIDGVLHKTIFVPITSTPVQGRFTATGTGVTRSSNGITIASPASAGTALGSLFAPDRTATVTHSDDSSLTFTVLATNAIDTVGAAGGSGTNRRYTLRASNAFTTTFILTNEDESTSQIVIPATQTRQVTSYATPTVFTGAGEGIEIIAGDLVGTIDNSNTVGGQTINVQSSIPMINDPTIITFVTP